MERQTDVNNSEIERVEKLIVELNIFLEQFETQNEESDTNSTFKDEEIVSKHFEQVVFVIF